MTTYEFINPSDPITFNAKNDKIAFACAVIVGRGHAGCRNLTTGESLPSMMLLDSSPNITITEYLEMPINDFLHENKNDVVAALESFAYGDAEDRARYDDAISAITDPEKLNKFKKKHEARNRSSMNAWVTTAWKIARWIRTLNKQEP